ncbi:MAG: prepilin-type N-terminal cleavage/methylation domain-containing protein [Pseudomonadales bacterium]|nr:prepilin-type N-terminal cleavage/methylation domain-containing protein [Pseudomonadales bacterium]
MDKTQFLKKYNAGFTLIELIVVIAVFSILFSISSISLSGLIPKANFVTHYESLLSDIKGQQLRSMIGDTNGSGDGSAYGIYFESNQYTLFTGPAYNPVATDNYVIELSPGINITENVLPSSSVVFLQNSGEISGFNILTSSFKLTSDSGDEKLINFNALGVVVSN